MIKKSAKDIIKEYREKRPEYNAEYSKAEDKLDEAWSNYDKKPTKENKLSVDKAMDRCKQTEKEWDEAVTKYRKAMRDLIS